MRKRSRTLALAIVVFVTLSGCGPRGAVPPKAISATIRPVVLIAEAIAGTALQVQTLAGDDGAPLLSARELAATSAAVFVTGTPIDSWATDMELADIHVVRLSDALDKNAPDGPWLSFRDSADMARLIRDTLDALYPGLKDQFDSRYATFMDQCSQADGRLKQLVWDAGTRAFLAEDTTWSSAARDFGLRVVVQPGLKGLDLSGADVASRVADWGAGEKTGVVVVNVAPGGSVGVNHQANGIIVCSLDALGATAEGAFVPWLESQLTLLGSAIGK